MSGWPVGPEVLELAACVEAGVPASVTNDKGDRLLILAADRQSADIVARLPAAGADRDAGGPSARATAVFYEHREMITVPDASR